MRNWHLLVLATFTLSACEGGGIGTVGSPAWQLSTTQEQKVAYFTQLCASYGFQRNTPEMAQCVQQGAQGAQANASARSAALAAGGMMTMPRQTICREINGIVTCTTY